ncbi:hydrogenase formation protein HypD [bacterium]|nr:hydrogenase formation protein HypD [bacterium]
MKTLVQNINKLAAGLDRDVTLMEVCGTHTMAAFRTGLRHLLPRRVRLVSGPGCPVCVTDAGFIDAAIELARRPGVIVATFGDLVRVPGSESSLEQERAAGAPVRVVYSPTDALNLARDNPDQQVVFLGLGFETTAPAVAWTIRNAVRDELPNYSVLCSHKTMPRAMAALLADPRVRIDGFICPGHVSVITGAQMYRPLCEQFRVPFVISGFEGWDMLKAVVMLLQQVCAGRAAVEVAYTRSVTEHGNRAAQQLLAEVFEPCDTAWRGLGVIPGSGLAIRAAYAACDAAVKHTVTFPPSRPHPGCRCGDVLRGVIEPTECGLFQRVCTPLAPVGPCMVSNEGTCAAYYKYAGAGARQRRRECLSA